LEAAVTNAQNQLDYATLRAPFSGTVAARYVDNFQTVQSQQPIVRLLDISKIEVTVQVPENVISLVPLVKQAVCRFDAIADQEFTGPITKIGSEASRTTRTYPVTVELDQPADVQILPGMAATIRAQPPEEAGLATPDLIVPPGAVFVAETGQQAHVWVAEEGAGDLHYVTRREVTTGQLLPVGIAITTGLQVGEWVVTAGVNSLREKQPVRILQEGSH
jgi:RND family efflux transporter MFP subunit